MLKLERPYKDDAGNRIPVLLDIGNDGTHVFEPEVDPETSLAARLRRVFAERGIDFFDRNNHGLHGLSETQAEKEEAIEEEEADVKETKPGPMTADELHKMRMEVLPQLYTSLGEMSQARDLLNMLLSSVPPSTTSLAALTGVLPTLPSAVSTPSVLSSATVSKPVPIISIQAFDAQLTIGGKDEALRKAAGVFKTASESLERARVRSENYWVDALKVRRANWGLIPAPLPFGAPTGKGADKASKDFLISFGLEESPPHFRRRATGRMPTYEQESETLVFPFRQKTRLIITILGPDKQIVSQNTLPRTDDTSLDGTLRLAQSEMVEHEIFSILVREAGQLPTASARVSERLIVIEAVQGVELKFELVDADVLSDSFQSHAKCDLIYHVLHALLLQIHQHNKKLRLGTAGIFRVTGGPDPPPPLLLQPIIDLLQYQVFCDRVKSETCAARDLLASTGISSVLRFEAVGQAGDALVRLWDASEIDSRTIGGQAMLRIDDRHTIRLSFRAPSSLTVHLSQATLTIASITQLRQLLSDELERYLLRRVCELGSELCEPVGGVWFIDLNRCVGRWDGCTLNFRVKVQHNGISCVAHQVDKNGLKDLQYGKEQSLVAWIETTMIAALNA